MFEGFIDARIQCDHCNKQFNLDKSYIGAGIISNHCVEYFFCPCCGYKYPYMIADKEQLRLNKAVKNSQAQIELLRSKGKVVPQSRLRLLESLRTDAEERQAMLRDKYLQAVTDQLNNNQ